MNMSERTVAKLEGFTHVSACERCSVSKARPLAKHCTWLRISKNARIKSKWPLVILTPLEIVWLVWNSCSETQWLTGKRKQWKFSWFIIFQWASRSSASLNFRWKISDGANNDGILIWWYKHFEWISVTRKFSIHTNWREMQENHQDVTQWDNIDAGKMLAKFAQE